VLVMLVVLVVLVELVVLVVLVVGTLATEASEALAGASAAQGLTLVPFQLNWSCCVHRKTQFGPLMCPGAAQVEL
jgi:hypothetical protein